MINKLYPYNSIFVCDDVNISICLMSQCPSSNEVSYTFYWSIKILSWWNFFASAFSCLWLHWMLVDVFHYVLHSCIFLSVSPLVLPPSSTFLSNQALLCILANQFIISFSLSSFWCLLTLPSPSWDSLLQMWGWVLCVIWFWLLYIQTSLLWSCNISHCGLLIHTQLPFHVSTVLHFLATLLQLVLQVEKKYLIFMWVSASLYDWGYLFVRTICLLPSLLYTMVVCFFLAGDLSMVC